MTKGERFRVMPGMATKGPGRTRSFAALRMTGRAGLGRDAAGQSGQGLAPEDVSTLGLGQGEGPVGYKLSRSDDAGDDGRGRSGGRQRRPERSSSGARSLLAPTQTGSAVLKKGRI